MIIFPVFNFDFHIYDYDIGGKSMILMKKALEPKYKLENFNLAWAIHDSKRKRSELPLHANKNNRRSPNLIIFMSCALLVLFITGKTTFGVDTPYKYAKHKEMSQKSTMHQIQTSIVKTFDRMEQRLTDFEATNQNLEGRINMLASEKERLNKTYTQVKVRLYTLEKDHEKLKKRATSLEIAHKKLSTQVNVAAAKKQTPLAQGTSVAQKSAKKVSVKPKSTAQKTAAKKISVAPDKGKTSSTVASAGKISEERQNKGAGELDIKKINEKGVEYGKKGMYDAAIKEFQKVAALEPEMPNIHYNLGLAYKKKGMIAEADNEFAEYERLKRQNN